MKSESVDHPNHYGGADNPHETIKCLAAWGLDLNAYIWNAAKYLSRAGKKGNLVEDLKKARWYLDYAIKQIESSVDRSRFDSETNQPVDLHSPLLPCGHQKIFAREDAGKFICSACAAGLGLTFNKCAHGYAWGISCDVCEKLKKEVSSGK